MLKELGYGPAIERVRLRRLLASDLPLNPALSSSNCCCRWDDDVAAMSEKIVDAPPVSIDVPPLSIEEIRDLILPIEVNADLPQTHLRVAEHSGTLLPDFARCECASTSTFPDQPTWQNIVLW